MREELGAKGKLCLLVLLFAFRAPSYGVHGKMTPEEELVEIEKKLKFLNKPAVKSIQSEDGDIIDCVDIYKQPAFAHPALRNHDIQMKPSFLPKTNTTTNKNNLSVSAISQVWRKNGSCPKGTIPVRRVRKDDLLKAESLENFGMKKPSVIRASEKREIQVTSYTDNVVHVTRTVSNFLQVNRSAAYLLAEGSSFIGASGKINVWNPYVESSDEYTTAQLWLVNGPAKAFESIEGGWMVNPSFYGDARTHFFVHWTADGSQRTGCFDLTCSGFVQTSSEVALGSALEPISKEWGDQSEISIRIYLDIKTSCWWLYFGDTQIGYWPTTLFRSLSQRASHVRWGGEVYSPTIGRTGVPHTATAMGSGDFAESMFSFASYIRHLQIMDYSLYYKDPEWVYAYSDEPYCYSALNHVQHTKETKFYFGGPGRDPRWCS